MSNINDFYVGIKTIRENNYFLETMAKAMYTTGNTILADNLMDIVLENVKAMNNMKLAFNRQIAEELETLKKFNVETKGD